jgi:hypothetical protein
MVLIPSRNTFLFRGRLFFMLVNVIAGLDLSHALSPQLPVLAETTPFEQELLTSNISQGIRSSNYMITS